jgi:hypothetical protein
MSRAGPEPNPERLLAGKLGRLLKDANRQFASDLDQPAAFRRVNARLAADRKWTLSRRVVWLAPAALLGLFALVGARWAQVNDAPVVMAEDFRGYRPKASPTGSGAPLSSQVVERATPRSSVRGSSVRTKARADSASTSAASVVPSAAAAAAAPSLSAAPRVAVTAGGDVAQTAAAAEADAGAGAGPDCLSLARSGKTRDAEACFLKRAQGSGLGAEMALYEVARMRRDVLADADGALRALAEYRARFPAGALRREADMSQLELLLQLGRSEDALRQSAELLSSSSSGERAAELHLLRGQILRKNQSKFAAAAAEYELAEKAGARAEVKYFRALCLEALGQTTEAAALFAQYVEQPRRPYAEDARRRLEKLKP